MNNGFSFGKITAARLNFTSLGERTAVIDFRGTWATDIEPGLHDFARARITVWSKTDLDWLTGCAGDAAAGIRALGDIARGVGPGRTKPTALILYGCPDWLTVRDAYELAAGARVICELDLPYSDEEVAP